MMENKKAVSGALSDEVLQKVSGGAGGSLADFDKEKTSTVQVFENPTPNTKEHDIDPEVTGKF